MNNDKEFLGTEPIGKLLVKLAVPTVIAQMVNMLYNKWHFSGESLFVKLITAMVVYVLCVGLVFVIKKIPIVRMII